MDNQIIDKASKLFLTQGYKTVTMDIIANELGISKKTIYQHYSSKPELIEKSCLYVNQKFLDQVVMTVSNEIGAIQQLIAAHRDIDTTFMMDKNTVVCELLKYYPDIAEKQKNFQEKEFVRILENNIIAGIEQGVYRPDLDVKFMSRFYIATFMTIEDQTFFPIALFSQATKQGLHLEHYIRSIATASGLELFLKLIDNQY